MKKLALAVAIIFVAWLIFPLLAIIAIPLKATGISALIVLVLVSIFSSAGLILSAIKPRPEPQNQTIIKAGGVTIIINQG